LSLVVRLAAECMGIASGLGILRIEAEFLWRGSIKTNLYSAPHFCFLFPITRWLFYYQNIFVEVVNQICTLRFFFEGVESLETWNTNYKI
jgi:hypothetical protein